MDLNSDVMQREGMQSTYSLFSSAGDVSTTTLAASAHSMTQPIMATQTLMPNLFAFQSLTPGSAVQPQSMGYVLPPTSQLTADGTASTLAGGSGAMSSTASTNMLQSTAAPLVQTGMTGVTRSLATVPATHVQPSSSASYSYSNRVSNFVLHSHCYDFYTRKQLLL